MTKKTNKSLWSANWTALLILFFLSFVYFLENFDRSLISVSPIPYVNYGSYEYSVLAGPAFTIVYTLGGVAFALISFTKEQLGEDGLIKAASMTKFNILSVTTFIFSVSFACTAFALYFWQQVLIRIAMGLAQSVITPFSTSIISDHFPPEVRGAAFGIFNIGTYISFSLSLSLGIYIYVEYGWQAGYILFGLIGVACSLIMPVMSCMKGSEHTSSSAHKTENILSDETITHSLLHDPSHTSSDHDTLEESALIEESSDKHHGHNSKSWYSKIHTMLALAYEICFIKWYNAPGIYMLCLATGIRLGAGYVWMSYTGAFFSDLFETDSDTDCSYSYNTDYLSPTPSTVCSSDYPYCVDGVCSALTSFPWHNKGMDSMRLVEYMAWVPIVGSGFGNVLGGFIADYFVGKQHQHQQQGGVSKDGVDSTDISVNERLLSETETNNDDILIEEELDITLLKGSESVLLPTTTIPIGTATIATATTRQNTTDQSVRMLIAGWSNLLPIPLVTAALLLEFPYCFLIMILSGMLGEMYMGQVLATLTDLSVAPAHYITPSVALFMFVATIIGGNTPLLIPLVMDTVGYSAQVYIDFTAASVYAGEQSVPVSKQFSIQHRDARQLQYALIYVLGACYLLSGLLYLVSYYQMRNGRKVKA